MVMSECAATACPGDPRRSELNTADRTIKPCLPVDASNAQPGAREPQLRPMEPPELPLPPGSPPPSCGRGKPAGAPGGTAGDLVGPDPLESGLSQAQKSSRGTRMTRAPLVMFVHQLRYETTLY